MNPPERTIKSDRLYQGRVVALRVDTVALSDSRTSRREIVEHRGSVAILPVDAEGNVLLVRQYRKAIERWTLEAPAGGLDEGEDPVAAAHRELREETGCLAGRLERLASFYTSPGFCTELMHAYLATNLTLGDASPEEDEQIQVERVPLAEAIGMAQGGEIQDGKTIAALLLAEKSLNFVR
ncbi:MAG: NUDIX hydrolase [Chloroflexi bacterium]|nr:NUDIX hydrolase [Chloroflexota bacterium]